MGDIEVAGMQTAEEALQHIGVRNAVFLGIHQADTVVDIISQLLAILYADHITGLGGDGVVDGLDQLLGLTGTLQAHNNINHRGSPP